MRSSSGPVVTGEYPMFFDLAIAWHIFREHWARLLLLSVVLSVLAGLLVFKLPSEYTSEATLLVEPEHSSRVGLDAVFKDSAFTVEHFETQKELILSPSLMKRVVRAAGLHLETQYRLPDTLHWWEGALSRHLPGLVSEEARTYSEEDYIRYAAETLLENVTVEPVSRTKIIKLSVTSLEPELAERAAKELVREYIAAGLESQLAKTRSANNWLGDRLDEIRADLSAAEQRLQEFLSTNKLVDVGGVRSLVEASIKENTAELLGARKTTESLRAVVNKIKAARGDWQRLEQIQMLGGQQPVQKARLAFLNAREQLSATATRYGEKHPKRQEAKTLFNEALNSYRSQLEASAQVLLSNFELAQQTVNALGGFAKENRVQLQELDKKKYQLRLLERDVDSNRQLYDLFLTKIKETDLSDDYQNVAAVVVDGAELPTEPSGPQRMLMVAVVFLATFLLGYAVVMLRTFMDQSVRSPDDLERALPGVAVLGTVPVVEKIPSKKLKLGASAWLMESNSHFAESIQSLRSAVLLSEPDRPNQVVMVTSAVPSEGKTTCSGSLALSFSRVCNTIIVEADLRKPTLLKSLGSSTTSVGLAQVIAGTHQLDDAIVELSDKGLAVLPSGAIPPNPLELLGSDHFKKVVEELRRRYDRVIIDSPPIEPVSDSLLVSGISDAIVYVAKSDSTSSSTIRRALNKLEQAGGRVIGVVLNSVDTKRLSKYYGADYYGYGATGYYKSAK